MIKSKKVPLRMCISCREMKPKKELIRIVCEEDGPVIMDLTGKKNGKGAYLCDNIECFTKAKKIRSIEKTFEKPTDNELLLKMEEYINRNK
jgi:hypothetical protein